jgi:NADPH:quinone reductase-like Zn-dependent oxidoreductase
MKAAVLHQFDASDDSGVPTSVPAEDELVQTMACGIDGKPRCWMAFLYAGTPFIMGYEIAGVVTDRHRRDRFQSRDRVVV